jgi:hypothetical protein
MSGRSERDRGERWISRRRGGREEEGDEEEDDDGDGDSSVVEEEEPLCEGSASSGVKVLGSVRAFSGVGEEVVVEIVVVREIVVKVDFLVVRRVTLGMKSGCWFSTSKIVVWVFVLVRVRVRVCV